MSLRHSHTADARWLGPGAKAVAVTVLVLAASWYGRSLFVPPATDASLAEAAAMGDYAGVERALRAGVHADGGGDVDAVGGAPLLVAAATGDDRIVELLLRHGADTSCTTAAGYTPLMTAAIEGNSQVIKLLLDAGADPNQSTRSPTTPLGAAAGSGNAAAIELLLAHGADPRALVRGSSAFHEPPLLCAIRASTPAAIVARLIEAGADVNAADDEGTTPLRAASDIGRDDLVQLLLRHGARRQVLKLARAGGLGEHAS